ncbi:terminase small subunit [uncultured Alteromonas sp.]|jgi:phage terminase Nu1 subunit (DNA packaging protein)|uniref:terminase small subunit n=1 Tax=uncultured Alteromonas sp. TaxID=179113 RepID=UPI0025D68300|nr:terminase small subunit [uncultured Alteromonas sp.]
MKLNRTELAELLGVTLPSIDLRIRKGMPFDCKGGRGKPWVFDSSECVEWEKQQAINNALGDTDTTDTEELKRRKLAAETTIAEIDAAKKRGEVASLIEIERVWSQALIELRTRLRLIPARVSSRVLSLQNESDIKAALLDEVDQALTTLAECETTEESE